MKTFNKKNEIFRAATKSEKRVMIAKDVLEQLKLKRIKAKGGAYVEFPNSVGIINDVKNKTKQVCELLEENRCECCAFGSMIISDILINDKVECGEIKASGFLIVGETRLRKYFSYDHLRLIERTFEGWECIGSPSRKFHDKYTDDTKRLIAIMKNIIKNKGTFIP